MRTRNYGLASLCMLCLAATPALAEPSSSSPAVAYNRSAVETAREAALGGGLRAFSNSVEALFSNPANMGMTRVYHMAGIGQFWSAEQSRILGAAIVDSVSSRSRLAGGVAVTWLRQDPEGIERSGRDIRGALAFPLSQQLFLGASARYVRLSQRGVPAGVLPPSVAASGLAEDDFVNDVTVDVGATLMPTESIRLAVVGNNLTAPGHSLLPLIVGGAVGFGTRVFTIESNLSVDWDTHERPAYLATGGMELLAAGAFPLRVGYRWDEGLDSHSLSAGAGYVSRQLSFDVAYRQSLGPERTKAWFFGVKYHVEAASYGAQ